MADVGSIDLPYPRACAEAAGADILLSTDDAFVRRARRLQHDLRVRVTNPVQWLKERAE